MSRDDALEMTYEALNVKQISSKIIEGRNVKVKWENYNLAIITQRGNRFVIARKEED